MQVIATAGHVDHGKSALLRTLTGMEPDRWAEERRRGMTIDLGFVWMRLPSGERLAFVDVPGHARFVPNMLAGVGPVPAVLFVVAADGGWMPQSAEHLAAIDALGITRGVLAVTRADLADPGPAMAQAKAAIGRSSLRDVPVVAVSAVTGSGAGALIAELGRLAGDLPEPDPAAPVRIWADRSFSISGAGTVLTGTLPAGTISRGDELLLTPLSRPVRVRGLQLLGEDVAAASGVSRIAINLRGIEPGDVARGMALVRPGEWTLSGVVDVRLVTGPEGEHGRARELPRVTTLHLGSARTQARVRPLGSDLARLTLHEALPLHVGDRVLLRDPGAAGVPGPDGVPGLAGAVVLDVVPPSVSGRGAAAAAAAELSCWPDRPEAAHLLRRHKLIRSAALRAMGLGDVPEPPVPGWAADLRYLEQLSAELAERVAAHLARDPLSPGMAIEAARAVLRLPDREIVRAITVHPLTIESGLIKSIPQAGSSGALPRALAKPVAAVLDDLAASPFSAPDAARLRELGLDHRGIATAARHGALLRIADQVVLAPGADVAAASVLAGLPQPFSAAQARAALRTTRRTLIPLLEHLDRQRLTRRLPDNRRTVLAPGDTPR
ncbi:MAG TPA: selenocysteine-specific translation elongation factor [Streptosporangiaceae bacterium]|nr:selenocysteine-specific translation elongation factor [Streptosporangiaceae bacterium]